MPSSATGQPPRWASQTTAASASRIPAQRSSGGWSGSTAARMTERMSNGFLRPGLAGRRRRRRRARGPSPARGAAPSRTSRSTRVGGLGAAREALARRDVGVLVVVEQHAAGAGEVGRPVLRLAVGAHDALVAADAEVVLGRDAARVVERLLAGQHHRALGRHHEDAARVHQHRRLGVPVRLRADVDARDDDVELAAGLRELDDPAQHGRDPVHVLGAAVHRDLARRPRARTTRAARRAPRRGRARR